ncbi:MAG: phosphoenolpyruvate synthase [Patescibacteria group bacterium]
MEESRDRAFVIWFADLSIKDVGLVGGKNASLGDMYAHLKDQGVDVPNGFAITSQAYKFFIQEAGLEEKIQNILDGIKKDDIDSLRAAGEEIRNLILSAQLPQSLNAEIEKAYQKLCELYEENTDVAVRSSATAEDLPGASFAGEQETFLNVSGLENLLISVKKCIASLFTDRAISYRKDKGFSNTKVYLSVGVQKMARSDLASSGVAFTIDTETGFDKVVIINSSYGLGEMIVQGKVTPDEFVVFKPSLEKGFKSIISKKLGEKNKKMIYSEGGSIEEADVSGEDKNSYSLSDEEILKLADWCVKIEKYFSEKYGHYQPMDIEWAKDGKLNELFIIQARPETVHSAQAETIYKEYRLDEKGEILIKGIAVGTKIATGTVKVLEKADDIGKIQKGDILVTRITDPDWEPIMKIASAIITDEGGRTSHAAIVSRELGIACIVGSSNATNTLSDGQEITVDCSSGNEGIVYKNKLKFSEINHELGNLPQIRTKLMANIGSPDEAFKYHFLPVKGVGLGRLEFIINETIKIHPNALINYEKLTTNPDNRELIEKIDKLTVGYLNKIDFYVERLASGIAKIAAVFWPNDVIIRFSDFKSNEYRMLIGGESYEPTEQNPMLGWRGASRYYHPDFKEAFGLECKAILKVRNEMGLSNVVPMVPFCRTPEESKRVIETAREFGLSKENDPNLKIYMMCEIPSNILLADDFLNYFDGYSIGSNDLLQLTLGIDRDSSIVSKIENENSLAVKKLIGEVIRICKSKGKYVGICGQAPSDFPDFTKFLIEQGIESISLNPDSILKMIKVISQTEQSL